MNTSKAHSFLMWTKWSTLLRKPASSTKYTTGISFAMKLMPFCQIFAHRNMLFWCDPSNATKSTRPLFWNMRPFGWKMTAFVVEPEMHTSIFCMGHAIRIARSKETSMLVDDMRIALILTERLSFRYEAKTCCYLRNWSEILFQSKASGEKVIILIEFRFWIIVKTKLVSLTKRVLKKA